MKSNLSFSMRLALIDELLQKEGLVNFDRLLKEVQCSAPTLKRDLRYLRDQLGAPIVYTRAQNGYYYSHETKATSKKIAKFRPELPAAWYTPDEMTVLLTVYQMFDKLEAQPGSLLAGEMRPIKARLLSLVMAEKIEVKELLRRVKVINPQFKAPELPYFHAVGQALSLRRRLRMTYFTRTRGTESDREISPLRMVNYRHRWYVEAWCHTTDSLKTFSIENIRAAEILTKRCKVVAMRDIEEQFDRTYGIFSGKQEERQTAVIEVDEVMTPYVRNEVWHEDQKTTFHDNGSMTLEVPFAKEPELATRVIGLGSHAKVVMPETLKDYVRQELAAALAKYDVNGAQ